MKFDYDDDDGTITAEYKFEFVGKCRTCVDGSTWKWSSAIYCVFNVHFRSRSPIAAELPIGKRFLSM